MTEAIKLYTSKDNLNDIQLGLLRTTIAAGNGTFEIRESWLGKAIKKVNGYEMVTYPELEEEITVSNSRKFPKVPKEAIMYAVKWYRNITKKNGEEAQINFYHIGDRKTITVDDKELTIKDIDGVHFWDDEVFSYVPKQENHGALTETSDKIYGALNVQVGIYVETHSHNSMGAFASGTDLANSGNDAIQLVFSKLNTDSIEMHSWITVREVTREKITPEELALFVELPEFTQLDGKYYFSGSVIDEYAYDENLFTGWDKQIIVRPKIVYTPVSKYNRNNKFGKTYNDQRTLFNDYDYYNDDDYIYGNNKWNKDSYKTAYTAYKPFRDKLQDASEMAEIILLSEEYMLELEGVYDVETYCKLVPIFVQTFVDGASLATYSAKTEDEIVDLICDRVFPAIMMVM